MRLFDHRPFLNGEIKFMLREFEEKRSDREIENLFSVIENAIDIKDNQIERLKHLSSANLPLLTSKLDEALAICDKIHNIELEKEKDSTLEQNRMSRKNEWSLFIEDISQKYVRIDNAFEQKEEELKDFYTDLEHKLNLTTN